MGLIALEGMRFYAYHGFYPEEQIVGNEYIVDIYLDANFQAAAKGDDLAGTINYETIYRITKIEMQRKTKLLEHLGQRIIDKIKHLFDNVEAIHIRISKKNPPMGGHIERAFIEIKENYWVKCNKCSKDFLSHFPGDCWTKYGKVYPETQSTLQRTFGRQICKSCIEPYLIPNKPD